MSSEPPEEPHQRSEPNTLSPASPKPIHFPAPTNIPVLEMQMDVGFNQTEAHMNDPAMHNTEVREDCWRDPVETPQQKQHGQQEQDALADEDDDLTLVAEATTEDSSAQEAREQLQNGDSISNEPSLGQSAPVNTTLSHVESHEDAPVSDALTLAQNIVAASAPSSQTPAGDTAALHPPVASHSNSVDVESLLDTLQTNPAAMPNTATINDGVFGADSVAPSTPSQMPSHVVDTAASSSSSSASGLAAPPTGLPPRPPPQEQPLIHPNYVHSQHIRDYHPHAAHSAYQPQGVGGSQSVVADPSVQVLSVQSPTSTPAQQVSDGVGGQPGNGSTLASPTAGGVPLASQVPPSASPADAIPTPISTSQLQALAAFGQAVPPVEHGPENAAPNNGYLKPEDRPWNAEIQRKYDRFLDEERRYVSEGRWEQFPQGSRLFVGMRTLEGQKMRLSEMEKLTTDAGNLSSERVTKRDIFHVFYIYGELAQISIKQAYGFVQFLRAEDCAKAMEMEQGTPIRDKRIHLEISKPQKSRNQQPARARSRSPDHGRAKSNSNIDRYVSGQRGGNGRRGSGGGGGGGSNTFRSNNYRSPSPRDYRDRYDNRYRERSRSPAYGRGSGGRYRSPSPRRDTDDDLPLPRRDPRDVPDVQIVVLDQLDRDFISWVEKAFSARGVRVDVLLLSPRLSEQAVVRRQIVEGVIAVSKLTRQNQNSAKVGLQIFDRRGGANNVSFEEYDNLDPSICAELVLRAKQTHAPSVNYGNNANGYSAPQYSGPPPPQPTGYMYGSQQAPPPQGQYGQTGYPPPQPGMPQYNQAPPFPPQNMPPVPHNLQNIITNLDSAGLQNLLSAMNPSQGGVAAPNPYAASGSPANPALAAIQNNPVIANYLRQQQQQQGQAPMPPSQHAPPPNPGPGQEVNMQEILARLGTYKH